MKKLCVMILITLLLVGAGWAKTVDFHFPVEINKASVMITEHFLDRSLEKGDYLRFWIDSPGGSVTSSIALYDYLVSLREQGIRVDTIATGICASGATVVLQAGETRYVTPFTLCLVHGCHNEYEKPANFWQWIDQKYEQWKDRGMKKYIDDDLADLYIIKTHQTRKVIDKIMSQDSWFYAVDFKLAGFADKIRGAKELMNGKQ